ncbi:MAG: hypothetical protein JWQ48_3721 [Conexibacter sp.]|nr:hypothetical protein [Conexibacter sp.]
MSRLGLRLATAIVVVLLAVDVGSASAQVVWGAPQKLVGDGLPIQQGDLVVRPDGSETAAWVEGFSGDRISYPRIWSATRDASGRWSAPVRIAPLATEWQDGVRLALAPDGGVTAVWLQHSTVQTATQPVGGAWSAPVALGIAGEAITTPDIAVDSAGNAAVAWAANAGAGYVVKVARRPAGGAWAAPDALAAAARPNSPRVATRSGGIAVVWQDRSSDNSPVHAAFRSAAGTWDPVGELARSGHAPGIGFDRGGAFAVWTAGDGATVQTSSRPATGSGWSPATALGDGAGIAIRQSAGDRSLAVWGRYDGTTRQLVTYAAERSARGVWQPTQTVATLPLASSSGQSFSYDGVIDANGAATVLWTRSGSTWASHRRAGGAWDLPVTVEWLAPHLALAVNRRGEIASSWASTGAYAIVDGHRARDADRAGRGPSRHGFTPPPQSITAAGTVTNSDIAVAPDGSEIAVWDARAAGGVSAVWSARRSPDGAWSTAERISPDDGLGTVSPRVVIDGRGVATVAWMHGAYRAASIEAVQRVGAGAWQAPQQISAVEDIVYTPNLAVDEHGDVTVAWVNELGPRGVEAATQAAGGPWQAPVTLASSGWAEPGSVAVATSHGRVAVVWQRSEPDMGSIWAAYRLGPTSAWEPQVQISPAGEKARQPGVGFDGTGGAVAVWSNATGPIESAERPLTPGTTWSPATAIGMGVNSGFDLGYLSGSDLSLAVGPHGDMLAVWGASDGVFHRVRSTERRSGDSWSTAHDVALAGAPIESFQVALTRDGAAAATWNEGGDVVGAARSSGGAGPRTMMLSTFPSTVGVRTSPRLAANARGDMAAIWETGDGVAAIGGHIGR